MKRPGIYIIHNQQTGQAYIGSSVDTTARLADHRRKLRQGKHPNHVLQEAWDAYGENAFTVVEIPTPDAANTNELRRIEQHYLDTHQTYRPERGYNQASRSAGGFFQRITSWRNR